jgi:predicted GNAT family acetyltransferase
MPAAPALPAPHQSRLSAALDHPVWAALAHAPQLAEGGDLARRYRRDVNLFAATRDDSPACLAALADLLRPGESAYLLQAAAVQVPPGLVVTRAAQGMQLLATDPITPPAGTHTLLDLGDADAADMLTLAQLTEPGPFLARTHTLGRFIGVRIAGQLVAMAGERMRFAGFTEISGVCTHPDARSLGLAKRLSATVAQRIQQRGEQAFLHAWASNHAAMGLYQSLGFTLRSVLQAVVLQRPA